MFKLLNICFVLSAALVPSTALGDTTFTNSTIESLDRDARQLTIRAGDGQSWSLPVESVELLKGVQKGDRVSLEIGPDDRVKKIIKSQSEGSQQPTRPEPSE